MAEKIPAPNGIPEHTTTLCSSFYLDETSEEEVLRLIENFSEGKAINENDIPTKVIRLSNFVVAPVLTCIFNTFAAGIQDSCFVPLCNSYNLLVDCARELFKPSKDAASLLLSNEEN